MLLLKDFLFGFVVAWTFVVVFLVVVGSAGVVVVIIVVVDLTVVVLASLISYGCCSFVSTTAVVDKPVGNNSHFTMIMTNCFCAQ